MNKLFTSIEKEIEFIDVDFMNECRLSKVFQWFSKIAMANAEQIGLWYTKLQEQYGWVVTKQSLHLDEPIRCGDKVKLETIPGKASRVIFPRYYFVTRDDGNVIGKCSSIWTLIDIDKRRIVMPRKIGLGYDSENAKMLLEEPEDIDTSVDFEFIETRQVRYSDVDYNQHMNNTMYIDWALDLIDIDYHREKFICDASIQYKKEIMPKENVKLYKFEKDQQIIVKGLNENDEECFIIEFICEYRIFS